MTSVFADTFYFIALINPKDAAHQRATQFSMQSRARLITTAWVLTELADALSRSPNRQLFRLLLKDHHFEQAGFVALLK